MALIQDGTTFRERLNVNQPQTVADKLCTIQLGNILRALTTTLWGKAPAASSYQLATLQAIVLSDFAKAAVIQRAYARGGTGTKGELTVVAYGATPTAGQIAVAPNGDIVTLGSDAWTLVDVIYTPRKHDVVEVELPVATGILTIPASIVALGVGELMEAEATAGTVTGKKIILVPADGLPATTKAQLKLDKTQVQFNNATDAVTKARVKLSVAPSFDLDAALSATSPMY